MNSAHTINRRAASFICTPLLIASMLAGCGGGDSGDDAGNSPQPGTIGPAGGTVQGPSGAQVVIPAGALSQNIAIVITQSSAGAPALPPAAIAAGQMFAFTPHGTTFASAATVTVPFDPALVASGVTPILYKTTTGQMAWETVAGATVSGNTLSAPVNSFSFLIVGTPPPPIEVIDRPWRYWEFEEITGARGYVPGGGNMEAHINGPPAGEGELLMRRNFGPLTFTPPDRDAEASGEIFSDTSGHTYWVEAEAPIADNIADDPERRIVGAIAHLIQKQSYRKNSDTATLQLVITDAHIELFDANGTSASSACLDGRPSISCHNALRGTLEMHAIVVEGSEADTFPTRNVYRWMNSHAKAVGFQDQYFGQTFTASRGFHADFDEYHQFVNPDALPAGFPIWKARAEDAVPDEIGFTMSGESIRRYGLSGTLTVPVDLSAVPRDREFTLDVRLKARVENMLGGESYLMARLRDPLNLGGVSMIYTGLTPTNRPVLGPITIASRPAPACSTGNDPDSGTLQFSAPSYVAAEFNGNQPVVFVTRSGGTRGEVNAVVSFTGGSAIAGIHFTATPQTIEFGDGDDVPRAVSVPVLDNTTEDGDVTLNLALNTEPGCSTIGAAAAAVLTIVDDEIRAAPPPTYTVSVMVEGLEGVGLIIEDTITGANIAPTADGAQAIGYAYPPGANYNVRIVTQPGAPNQVCSVTNGSGVIADADVTDVGVVCVTQAQRRWLDPNFGTAGKVHSNDLQFGRAVAVQPGGRIVVLSGLVLAGFNADGSVDASFGIGGRAAVQFNGGLAEEAYGMSMQPDGKLVVVGRARTGTRYDMGVTRFNADGSLDLAFGSLGVTTFNPYHMVPSLGGTIGSHYANKSLIGADGKIYIAGAASFREDTGENHVSFAVARLNADGTPDVTFSGGTGSTMALTGDPDIARSLAMQSDGKVVLAGSAANSTRIGLVRWLTDGSVDTAIQRLPEHYGRDGAGYVLLDATLLGLPSVASDIVMLEDDSVVVAAAATVLHATLGGVSQIRLVHATSDGEALASGDYIITPIGPDNDIPYQLLRQPDGKFLLAAQVSSAATVADFGLVRYNADLTLDTAFGENGVLLVDFFGARDGAVALALQPDGKIVVVGSARNGSSDRLGMMRVNP